jgi:hypothetical protein
MNEIDYTKWSGSMFCRTCVKELTEEDRSTTKVKVPTGQLFSPKFKVPVCNECRSAAVGFSKKICFETNPIEAYLRCFFIILFCIGFFWFLVNGAELINGSEPKEGASQSTDNVVAVLAGVFLSAASIWFANRQNTICKEIIKKIESKKNRQTI